MSSKGRQLELDKILEWTGGKAFSEKELTFTGIGTDTRKDMAGQLFIALKGESFDAHEFCAKAVQAGATGILIHRMPEDLESLRAKVSVIVVKDTLRALQDIAHHVRHESKSTVVAITGSNGKTTSKEFCAAVVGSAKMVHYSKGSFNNHWGLPFSILEEPAGTQVSILEMGMNHAGEIARLCEIADPDIVVCSTVGRSHIEYFGTIEKIAEAKNEIYKSSPAQAQRIYNLDNPFTYKMFQVASSLHPLSQKVWTFSQKAERAHVFLQLNKMTLEGLQVSGKINGVTGSANIPVFGAQNLTNVMVAATVGLACGMSAEKVWEALPRCRTNWGRNQILQTESGAQILFDGYNANPDSVTALLENVQVLSAEQKIGVFGEMLELGELASNAHYEVGEKAGKSGLDVIWFYGPHATDFEAGVKASGFSKKLYISNAYEDSLASQIASVLKNGSFAFVKGSRGMKMERFVMMCRPLHFSLTKE